MAPERSCVYPGHERAKGYSRGSSRSGADGRWGRRHRFFDWVREDVRVHRAPEFQDHYDTGTPYGALSWVVPPSTRGPGVGGSGRGPDVWTWWTGPGTREDVGGRVGA